MKRDEQRKLKLRKLVLCKLTDAALGGVQGGNTENGYHSSCGQPCTCPGDPNNPPPDTNSSILFVCLDS